MVFVAVSKNNEVHFSFMFLFLSSTLTLVTHYYIIFITVDTKFFVLKSVLFFTFWGKSYHILHCQIFSGYGLCNEKMHEFVKWAKESTKKVYNIDRLIMHLKKFCIPTLWHFLFENCQFLQSFHDTILQRKDFYQKP